MNQVLGNGSAFTFGWFSNSFDCMGQTADVRNGLFLFVDAMVQSNHGCFDVDIVFGAGH